jgi:DNA-binding CsgD family transcriptional regulator
MPTDRAFKDPSYLTPYEQKIYDLSCQGLNPAQISEALNGSSLPKTIDIRLRLIREKVALKEITDAQDRRISWG